MSRAAPALLLIVAVFAAAVSTAAQQPTKAEAFFEAVRRGDLAAVKSLLDQGVNVNEKFRYGTTALFPACDRGHLEIVKLLLDRGAEVNVRDTFYGATPLTWAASKGHAAIVKLLLDKGAQGVEGALMSAVNDGSLETVRVILERGGLKPETLSSALSAANRAKQPEIAKLLEEAGAKPPPKANFQVDAETLALYAGTYRNATGGELSFFLRDGKFFGGPRGQEPFPMNALNKTTFRPGEFDAVSITFHVEDGPPRRAARVTIKQSSGESTYDRVEEKPQ